ncbi:penicillin-binding transpeptidase domain-containing protein [Bacteroides sp. 51]|uniref:penicillin-binding transpeptidase domain-containing protein n=1 Tax=Bacteroides sp. 51 TaxID=2302938 RepID=UPI0013D43C65|nr:penicillin-binding transpeptidase domain-containing protein [Bacteroides sp. 51]NDV84808.1 penicillin-binding protein [Bacteroides sp. 51]
MKYIINVVLLLVVLSACTGSKQSLERTSTIDSTLQSKTYSILKDKLSEIDALSGLVIIMETKTGEIKAMVGLERRDSATNQSCSNLTYRRETGLMHPISLLTALESGKASINDTVDTGKGEYLVYDAAMRDHNWQRGGYGELTLEQGIMLNSNIATIKTIEKLYGENPQTYFDALERMSYGKPDSICGLTDMKPVNFVTPNHSAWSDKVLIWFSIGYYQQISPIQVLTFYNAIANDGVMVQPQLYKDFIRIINPQIASKENITYIQQVLEKTVSDGLGKPAYSDKMKVGGNPGTVHLGAENGIDIYGIEFCGYFPADNPEYTMIVSINKIGLPASGGLMAGDVFNKIIDLLYDN